MTLLVHAAPRIAAETARDARAREKLLDAAFGPARFEKTCERLREGRRPAHGLAFAAHDAGQLVATLRLWDINAGGVPALLLGPLAVARSHRALCLGGRMMRHALASAALRGHRAVLLVGDADYYSRFGFSRALTQALTLPGPVEEARFLGFEISGGALTEARGMVRAAGAKAPRSAVPPGLACAA